jgi:hypothetical protein
MHRLRVEPDGPLPLLELPNLVDGVDLGSLYELGEALVEQGVTVAGPVGTPA